MNCEWSQSCLPNCLSVPKTVSSRKDGHVLIVTLNRPEAKNAFSPEMLLGLYKAWRLLDEDDDLRCAILTANGDTFCAGMDLKAGADGQQRSTEEFMELMATVPNIH
jgi:enoyl-CoA hydratase